MNLFIFVLLMSFLAKEFQIKSIRTSKRNRNIFVRNHYKLYGFFKKQQDLCQDLKMSLVAGSSEKKYKQRCLRSYKAVSKLYPVVSRNLGKLRTSSFSFFFKVFAIKLALSTNSSIDSRTLKFADSFDMLNCMFQSVYLRCQNYFGYFSYLACSKELVPFMSNSSINSNSFVSMILHCMLENVQSCFFDYLCT